jgi:tRNA threonylcarbamoyl adenosine modification protein (Sua5/YciO/YrdC/YwlC family)
MPPVAPIVEINSEHPQPRTIERAAALVRDGGVIAYPTDTVYALGCDLSSKRAIEKLYALKRRDLKKPMAFLCPDLSDVSKYAQVTTFAYRTMKHLAPGPFTFVLPATRLVPQILQSKRKEVGIRVPDSAIAHDLTRALGRPLVTTSATELETGEPLLDARAVKDVYGHGLELILDGDVLEPELSTIVSLLDDRVEILRQGKGDVEQ